MTMNALLRRLDQHDADIEAIRHELEAVWEAINELQGIDPAKVGEPDGNG
jgi:Asp-tRNA(Asn)/Glu-tRNA(Gln) amidotransferase C subunit